MKNGVDVSHLPDPSQVKSEDSAVKAYSQVLDCVHHANRELAQHQDKAPGDDGEADHDALSGRLTEWLLEVHRIMKVIIRYIPHLFSYSCTFGTTISMTMNFVKPDDENGQPISARPGSGDQVRFP